MKPDAKKRSLEASNLDSVAQALVTVAVAIPILFNPGGANAFELPKAMALRALALLLGVVTVADAVERGELRRRRPPLYAGALLALSATLVAATALSRNPRLSLWGSYDRQQGLVTAAGYAILFLAAAYGLRTRDRIDRLWGLLVAGSAPVVAYGLLQALGLDPLAWQTDAASPVLATLGRSNFLGSYLVLVIPLTAGRALLGRRRLPVALLLAGQVICLAVTLARGAWMGFGASVVTGLLAWSRVRGDRRPALVALAIVVLAAGFVLLLNLPAGPLAPLARLPGLDRLATLFQTGAGSTAARITIWRATLPLVTRRPWLGYGPETFRLAFARVYPPQLVYYQGREVIVDRAHNLWLDLAVSAGIPAALALATLLFDVGRRIRRGLRPSTPPWRAVAWTALAASFTGHLVDLQFGFETASSATVFALLLAMVVALSRPPDDPEPAPPSARASLPYLPALLVALILTGLIGLRPLVADVAYRRSTLSARSLTARVRDGERAVRLWSLEPTYRLGLARTYALQGAPDAALRQLEAARRLSPRDPEAWAAQGAIYAELARLDRGAEAYRRAVDLAPNVARYHQALGLTLARQGRLEEAIAELERAVALDATDVTSYRRLADLYAAIGEDSAAEEARQSAAYWERKLGEGQNREEP